MIFYNCEKWQVDVTPRSPVIISEVEASRHGFTIRDDSGNDVKASLRRRCQIEKRFADGERAQAFGNAVSDRQ
jgi:hypothetical protein